MNPCIVIPTYWATPKNQSWEIFDHPTPVQEQGTLGRTLENFAAMGIDVPVILFPAPTDPAIEARVKEIAAPHRLNLHTFTGADLAEIRGRLNFEFPETLHMNSYGAIRNMGLLWAALKGYDAVIQIDDDELIEDPKFLSRALGDAVAGKSGYYIDDRGNKYYDGQLSFELPNWPKDRLFNENIKRALEVPKRLAEAPLAFGGNMVIHREMYLKVPYDPYGTRGEDDDYVLNAKYAGMPFYFDQELWVRHLPPKREGRFWTRHRQDILRFRYMREKTRLMGFKPEELGIFLEYFAGEDLEYKAVSSSIGAALQLPAEANDFL
jgi:hypothetical protein